MGRHPNGLCLAGFRMHVGSPSPLQPANAQKPWHKTRCDCQHPAVNQVQNEPPDRFPSDSSRVHRWSPARA